MHVTDIHKPHQYVVKRPWTSRGFDYDNPLIPTRGQLKPCDHWSLEHEPYPITLPSLVHIRPSLVWT